MRDERCTKIPYAPYMFLGTVHAALWFLVTLFTASLDLRFYLTGYFVNWICSGSIFCRLSVCI
jgi:hypothetical protein